MIPIRDILLVLIGGAGVAFLAFWVVQARRNRAAAGERAVPGPRHLLIGFVTNFFDTLGIGSFATTTAAFKALRMVPDEHIPGTMLIGHTLPVVAQALIFVAVVDVDPILLLTLMVAMVAGGWLGAGVVSKLPRAPIQVGMGIGLLMAALFMVLTQLGLFPGGGAALALPAGKLVFAALAFAFFGAALMIGIGHYAPCLILLSLLGMDPRAAFPVMMGAGALVGMAGGARFIGKGKYNVRAAAGLALGGIPAVLLAGLVVKSLPLDVLRWVVVAVVVYAATMMLRSALAERNGLTARPATPVT
jgi:uncharacterized membrane protein YfcA